MLAIPPELGRLYDTLLERRLLPSSSVLTTKSGCVIIGTSVTSMPWSRRIGRVFRLLTISGGPRISLNPSTNKLTRSIFYYETVFSEKIDRFGLMPIHLGISMDENPPGAEPIVIFTATYALPVWRCGRIPARL